MDYEVHEIINEFKVKIVEKISKSIHLNTDELDKLFSVETLFNITKIIDYNKLLNRTYSYNERLSKVVDEYDKEIKNILKSCKLEEEIVSLDFTEIIEEFANKFYYRYIY